MRTQGDGHALLRKVRDDVWLTGREWINFLHSTPRVALELTSEHNRTYYLAARRRELYLVNRHMSKSRSLEDIGLEEVDVSEYLEMCCVTPYDVVRTPFIRR